MVMYFSHLVKDGMHHFDVNILYSTSFHKSLSNNMWQPVLTFLQEIHTTIMVMNILLFSLN